MSEPNIKHLEFIQSTIMRMNTNSFHIKSWTITIVAAFLAIFSSTKNELFILTSLFPVTIFWLLDTYYLTLERKFRGLYNDIAGVTDKPKDIKEYEMRPDLYVGGKYSLFDVFKSPTILWLYFPLILFLIGAYAYSKGCF